MLCPKQKLLRSRVCPPVHLWLDAERRTSVNGSKAIEIAVPANGASEMLRVCGCNSFYQGMSGECARLPRGCKGGTPVPRRQVEDLPRISMAEPLLMKRFAVSRPRRKEI